MNAKSSKKIISTTVFAAIIVLLAFTTMCTPVSAHVNETQINKSIANGTAWLAAQQNSDGSWGTWDKVGKTGLAVTKLAEHAVDSKYGPGLDSPFNPDYIYADNVSRGLDYLFENAYIINISSQTQGNPDTNGNGIGVYFVDGNDPHHRNYETGIALMAIAASRDPGRIVGPKSNVSSWTYAQVAQDTVDYLAWSQADSGNSTGGWGYAHCDNGTWLTVWDRSDNSNTGWVTFGLGFAESPAYRFNCAIPTFVKTELSIWIDYIQNKPGPADDKCWGGSCDNTGSGICDGGSGYEGPNCWINILKTGHLLYEMALVGDTATTPRVVNATNYLVNHWNDTNTDPGWRGNQSSPWYWDRIANYHATFNVMKGSCALDIHELGGSIDWQADFEQVIVAQQNKDGSWSNCHWGDPILCTEWALLTLEKVFPPLPMTPGKVTGGGQIEAPVQTGGKKVDKASFGFNVMYQKGDPAPRGELEYIDHATKMNVHCHDMTRLVVFDNKTKATFDGACTIDGVSGYTFKAYVEDNGEPGKNDVFEITLSTGYIAGGQLLNGNIQIHKKL